MNYCVVGGVAARDGLPCLCCREENRSDQEAEQRYVDSFTGVRGVVLGGEGNFHYDWV